MARSTKRIEDLSSIYSVTSTIIWNGLEGGEVIANLDWDDEKYYVWLEPSWGWESFCEENSSEDDDLLKNLEDLRAKLNEIGVREFRTLDAVNEFVGFYDAECGTVFFYEDEYGINGV